MKLKIFAFLLFSIAISSCKNDDGSRLAENAKDIKKKELTFSKINSAWNFNVQPMNQSVENSIKNWAEWRLFVTDLNQKPKSSIGAFQQKAKSLSKKVTELQNNIPSLFNKPEVISRIMTVGTKVKSLDLYLNLSYIQEDKVLKLIPEINSEIASLQSQMEEILKKSQIKLEEGEAEMLQSIAKDSILKPQPIQNIQQKPSNIQGDRNGIIPTLNPKQTRQ